MQDNPNFEIRNNQLILTINSKVYPLEAVYSAAYSFMDKAYIVLDGDPKEKILVKMTLKSEGSLETLGNDFNNELLNYADYLTRAKETKKLREMFLQRAIITNDPGMAGKEEICSLENIDDLDESCLENPEEIAIPWEEKHGKNAEEPPKENENNAE